MLADTPKKLRQPRFLWFLLLSYVVIVIIANVFDFRLVNIFGLVTDAGTIIFPLTFLLSGLIAEVYGYKNARQAVWLGFLFNVFFILYGQIVIHLPSPSYPNHNDVFSVLFAFNMRIMLASGISYLCSEPLSSYILSKLKIKTKGRWMLMRFVASTVSASFVDSFIFGTLAFYGVMQSHNLLALILTMWLVKVIVEVSGVPLSLKLANALKRKEQMDIYDIDTRFNLFRLECGYTAEQNKYPQ